MFYSFTAILFTGFCYLLPLVVRPISARQASFARTGGLNNQSFLLANFANKQTRINWELGKKNSFRVQRLKPSALLITCFILSFIVFSMSNTAHAEQAFTEHAIPEQTVASSNLDAHQIRKLTEELKYLDEVLTASVLTYIFTGEPKWLERYQAHEPKLNALLEALATNRNSANADFINQIDTANKRLLATETIAIKLSQQGQRDQAMKLLSDDVYLNSKERYISATSALLSSLKSHAHHRPLPKIIHTPGPIELSSTEQAWLESNTITVGVEHWPPIIFERANGEIGGVAGGLLTQISKRTGLKFEIVSGQWNELLQQVQQGNIDLLPDTYVTESRAKFGLFSQPYYQMQEKLFVLKANKHLRTLEDIQNSTVAIPKGYTSIEQLKARFPDVTVLETESIDDSINAVINGQADALLDAEVVVKSRIKSAKLTSLVMIDEHVIPPESLHFFIAKQNPELLNIINKGLETINVDSLVSANKDLLDASDVTKIQKLTQSSQTEIYYLAAGLVLVLILFGLGISMVLSTNNEEKLAERFGSKRFQHTLLIGLVGLAIILVSLAFVIINNAENKINQVLSYNMTNIMSSTHNRLTNWVDGEFSTLNELVKEPELINTVEQLLLVRREATALNNAQAQQALGQFINERLPNMAQQGYFVISPDMINLASSEEAQIGIQNLASRAHRQLFNSVLAGDSKFIPPITSQAGSNQAPDLATSEQTQLIFAVPIYDKDAHIIAILAVTSAPDEQFSRIFSTGFVGKSGQSYAFNSQGQLLSQIRFENQLKTLGLVAADQSAILNMRLSNPGKNLLKHSFTPEEQANWPLTTMADSATRGFTNTNLEGYNGFLGVKVVGSWLWDDKLNIGIAAEVDFDETVEILVVFRYTILGIICVALALIFGCTLFTLKLGTRATQALTRSHTELECIVAERTRELQSSIDRTRTIISNASDAIIIVDDQGIIDSFGPSAEQMFGYSKEEMIGQPVKLLMEKPFNQIERSAMANGHVVEQKGIRSDGSIFDIGISVSDFTFDDDHFYTGAVRDITVRKEAQRALEEAKNSAVEATKAKSDFLANMSHEIRTPMNAIIGMSYLTLQTQLTDKQQDYLNKIHSSADALLGIINDILDFSKIEAGKLTLEHVPFNLTETLDHVVEVIALKSQQKGIELLIDLPANLPTCLVGDSLRLGQILVNLATNAVKFTDHGEIIIKVEAIEEADQELTLQFSVSDTGIGLTEAHMQNLFKSFSQADASTTRKYGGTGLGLTICKTLTEMMGGKIWVESEYQKGSTFSFTARLGKAGQAISNPQLAIADAADIKILIVDDSVAAREILHTIAQSIGFTSVIAESADHALQQIENAQAKQSTFDIVLTDWRMPHKNGSTLIKEILALGLPTPPKFIMLTAYDRDDMIAASKGLPISAYLTKPITASTLLDANLKALGRSDKVTRRKNTAKLDVSSTEAIQGANILLVEDNEINQQIAVELLEMAHFNVDIAEDGQQAVTKVFNNYANAEAETRFDAVLMDIQMPVMDGYQATAEIREKISVDELPIIAMTANAMAGDRERCLQAGMNDHLTKPISPSEVFNTLAEWISPKQHLGKPAIQIDETTNTQHNLPAIPLLDTHTALARIAGNVPLYLSLLDKFVHNHGQSLVAISDLIEQGDNEQATRMAHTLKGVAASIGAEEFSANVARLEQALVNEQNATQLIEELHQQLLAIVGAINSVELPNELRQEDSQVSTELDGEALDKLHTQLCSEIADFDAEAQETWRAMRKQLNSHLAPDVDACLSNALNEYDFEQAEQYLPAIEQTIRSLNTVDLKG